MFSSVRLDDVSRFFFMDKKLPFVQMTFLGLEILFEVGKRKITVACSGHDIILKIIYGGQ